MKITSLLTVPALAAMLAIAPNTYASDWSQYQCGPGWGPEASTPPTYPKRAQQRGIEGYVVMSFSVMTDGTIEDIAVVDAKPKKAFVRTATNAVRSMAFPPCVEDGRVVKLTDVSIKYDFNLEG